MNFTVMHYSHTVLLYPGSSTSVGDRVSVPVWKKLTHKWIKETQMTYTSVFCVLCDNRYSLTLYCSICGNY